MIAPADGTASVVSYVPVAGGMQRCAHFEHRDHSSCQTALLTAEYIAQTSTLVSAHCVRIKSVHYVKKNIRVPHFYIT